MNISLATTLKNAVLETKLYSNPAIISRVQFSPYSVSTKTTVVNQDGSLAVREDAFLDWRKKALRQINDSDILQRIVCRWRSLIVILTHICDVTLQ